MADDTQPLARSAVAERAHPPFERVALLLQGGGALGAYQAGVYAALAEANLHPDWVAGISIGGINAALIAGNPPEARVARLREFWEAVSEPPFGVPYLPWLQIENDFARSMINQTRALGILFAGAPTFLCASFPCALHLAGRLHSRGPAQLV